ncbi:MAG: DUF805 domain-containing protein [Sphingomonadaceae bacterium]|nr:DUF805 domain-containing protein [Sphingomonadaceae bacterium]
MEWMLMPLRRYADFAGRSRRREFWMFYLFNLLCGLALGVIMGIVALVTYSAGWGEEDMMIALIPCYLLILAWSLVLIIPQLAVTVRRLHDQDKSGWMYLLVLIPLVGGIIIFVFMCLEGTRGPNQYGPDPKGENLAGAFS